MPVTNTQEEFNIRSIGPVKINPSLLEGGFQYTSILGPKKGQALERFAPQFLFPPVISGGAAIPGTLICTPGTVSSAPLAIRGYQWFADGVAVDGAVFPEFTTYEALDGQTLTCQVTATNPLGVDVALSNAISVSLVLPVEVNDLSIYTIVGIGAEDNVTVSDIALMSVTGLPVDNEILLTELDLYTVIFPTFLQTLSGPVAENGMTGWTNNTGTVTTATSSGVTGTSVFTCSADTGGSANFDIPLDPALYANIDVSNILGKITFWATNNTGTVLFSDVEVALQAIDGVGAVTTVATNGMVLPPGKGTNTWYRYDTTTVTIPPGTRTMRVRMIFNSYRATQVQVDDIQVSLFTAF